MKAMDKNVHPKNHLEGATESVQSVDNTAVEVLDGEAEVFEGRVSEVAQSGTGEEWSGKNGQAKPVQQGTQSDGSTQLSERELLRERLLKQAPKAPAMRQEIRAVLEEKKVVLEKNLRHYERSKEYHLLSEAIQQLRTLVRQMESVAHASYELLKEIWLRVVCKFA